MAGMQAGARSQRISAGSALTLYHHLLAAAIIIFLM